MASEPVRKRRKNVCQHDVQKAGEVTVRWRYRTTATRGRTDENKLGAVWSTEHG